MREQFANNASSTLDGGIDDSQTTITVVDGSTFPDSGNFRLICESEYMLCTGRSGETLTVVRGIEGSTPAAHTSGTRISQILTVGSIQALVRDVVPHLNATPFRMVAADGTPLTLADFTKTDGGTATTPSEVNGVFSVLKTNPGSGANITTLDRPMPTPPYQITAAVRPFGPANGPGSCVSAGIGVIDSGTGRLVLINIEHVNNDRTLINVSKYSSRTNLSARYLGGNTLPSLMHTGEWVWLRFADDGDDLTFSISPDGYHWGQFFQVARDDYAANPDTVCFATNCQTNTDYFTIGQMAAWIEG